MLGRLLGKDNWQSWPGPSKNVMYWVELKNGYAIGMNENPSLGLSFPVIKLRK